MHSVGRSSEPGDPVRGSVAQADPVVAAPQVGNSALAQMAAGAQPAVAPIAIAKPASAPLSLDDPSFNPTTRAHDLLRAIDSEQYKFAMKASDTPFGGMTEDVSAERRKIDFAAIVAALDGLTAGQVKRVEEVFFEFEKRTTLKEDYLNLPDEMVAWDAGRQVAEAVRLHHDLAVRIVAARKQLAQADRALEAGGAGRARQRLEAAVAEADRRLNDLLDILADRTGRNP